MKKYFNTPFLFFILIGSLLVVSCQDETYVRYTANVPVYMSYEDLRSAVKTVEVHPLANPGKLYFKDGMIYINEYMKGIHIFDNSDPANPQAVSFIEIPGNVDMAIRDHYLYADSYIDLVVIDIIDVSNPVEIDREENLFEYTLPEYDEDYQLAEIDQDKGVVIEWNIKEVKELVRHQDYYYPIYWYAEDYATMSNGGNATGSSGGSEFGVGGSMTRFGQYNDFLLIMKNSWQVSTFSVDSYGKIEEEGDWNVGWSIETMFIRDHTMFIGSQSGMFIYDLTDLPVLNRLSQFMHFTACDPVVADDNYAYVTLRTGGACGSGQNVLEVVNIKNLATPYREKTYQLKNPHGLGIDDEILFVCDGIDGLKVFDASYPAISLPQISHFEDIHAYDVIPLGNILFMIGDDGFYQYDYTDIQNITLLSKIEVVPNENTD